MPLLVIAAGGTGGHMFPAQALAEEMLARGWRVRLSTDARGARYADGFPEAVPRDVVRSGSFTQGGVLRRLMVPALILAGSVSAWRAMRRDRPACIAGFGGYPAMPALVAGMVSGVPRLIHEQNGVLGRVNRLFARSVDRVACGTWPTPVPSGADAVFTGNPVRAGVLEMHGAHYRPPGKTVLNLLVIGGSQGASSLSNLVPEAVAGLPDEMRSRMRISQQARPADLDAVQARYEELGIDADVRTFFTDVPQRLSDAQLVISRAGASSVADIAVIGRPSILLPYPAATDDHQTANASGLATAGGAVVLQEAGLTPERITAEIARILGEPEVAIAMARAAAGYGRPEATLALADLVTEISKSGQKT
ncbi:UDP-N-acetylglucosamine--N-acetylmuramyl-(pentapeptide) pyrophosphoryl-undecaprenol N-acetylglucosamine transferase [Rhodobacteraceae bacterium KN286]|uniref:UDP-N-acetylglucosamine--N-acetylmuramyl-(pentapeptide) pyrophosphoryl-undecaprenol N-acetylglucosamine transferase n=2 Tax=Oceanomicrobium pacificus TaxID=2692916 RepID=A0A6B0TUH0_9RHOB|nr:UDP-N-acetylglucosamine--N-acetylmuramyl-(pentapeptide) pyrophosphoryl-undecaprenol N-acetylglucosamine transferase [Oceanomicrobium pacificus]